ncbi:MAG TPA: CRTAC1 family protein [Candidatus Sulfotelmatobacter sp.]|nr:CRTAC1 family protein [Candidatus Sulfotelmatobacter sp.]
MSITSLLLLVLNAPVLRSGSASSPIEFQDIADKAGVHFVTENSPTPEKHQPETMPAGVALFDYDEDGLLDIYLVNGAEMPSLVKTGPKYYNRLFHNNGNGTFTDVTERAGLAGAGYGMGVAVGDFDNDGWPDLFLANVNGNQLFHNNRDGTFTDVTVKAGLSGAIYHGRKMWSISAGWFDYNNDGLLDLFVTNYCEWDPRHEPACMGLNGRGYCHPNSFAPLPNTLYRNNGDGTFTDVSDQTGISAVQGKGMGVAFADYDGDGFLDVFVANDNSQNLLFHNLAGKRFVEVAFQLGVAYNEDGVALAGMGVDFRDLDNNGLPDIWHTAIENETFPLFLNRGGGRFSNATQSSGLTRITRMMSGWSNGVADLDNDGWKDLVVARGNVMDNIEEISRHFHYAEPNSVFRNLGDGQFTDVSATAGADFLRAAPYRGLAYGDLDNDGRIDLVVTVLGGPVRVFRNVTETHNHWILLKLVGTKSNRMGIGAQIRITTDDDRRQYDEVTTSTGYSASSDPRVHFGLGTSQRVREIEIRWPSGTRQVLRDVTGDRLLVVTEKPDGS